jgi:DNA-binding MarR family transcriptional regulator
MPADINVGNLHKSSSAGDDRERRTRVITLITLFRSSAGSMIDELVERLQLAGFDDVPASQHPVLENLDPGGTRLTTLSARAGMTHQSMGELVSILERNGYVERRPDPSDRRARLVCHTDKGRALVRQAIREIAEIEADWLERCARAGLGGDLREALQAALSQDVAARE